MTMSQLLLTRSATDQKYILDDLEEIHRAGFSSYIEGLLILDCPYRYGCLEYAAWEAGWHYGRETAEMDEECARA